MGNGEYPLKDKREVRPERKEQYHNFRNIINISFWHFPPPGRQEATFRFTEPVFEMGTTKREIPTV